eukprot:g6715.t1
MTRLKLRRRMFPVLLTFVLIVFALMFLHTSNRHLVVKEDYIYHSPNAISKSNTRQYEIKSAKSISGCHKHKQTKGKSLQPVEAGFDPEFQEFVVLADDGLLRLQNRPYFLNGFNSYYMHSRSAWIPQGRAQVDRVFEFAKELGMNALRTWAFADGDIWNALHPLPGIIDEDMFREGLDYVVYKARIHGIRLILTLTNYNPDFGGMAQYLEWKNSTNITEFYTDLVVKEMYKDYVHTVMHRINSYDKVMYKDNPTILGWELVNEPRDPGVLGSDSIQSWIEEMSSFIKLLDAKHLVLVGLDGYYGPSTPHLLSSNPKNLFYSAVNAKIPIIQNDAVCQGTDFLRNNEPEGIDISVTHLYPDSWLSCDEACSLKWTRKWIRDHAELAKKLKKPLLIGEFGKLKPISARNRFLSTVYKTIDQAILEGLPIAGKKTSNSSRCHLLEFLGSLVWMLGDENYSDYDGFTIFPKQQTLLKKRVPTEPPREMDKALKMFNYQSLLQCLIDQAELSVSERGESWNEGWNLTQKIIEHHTEALEEFVHNFI